MIQSPLYFDNNATTRVDPRVLEAMLPYFTEHYGNAASRSHPFGWKAEQAVEAARATLAQAIGAKPEEVVFTSGATESDNLAIKGAAMMYRAQGDHIITAQTEHKAILDSCKRLEQEGFNVTYLKPRPDGLFDLNALADAFTERTILVSIMHANNEIGVLQDIAAIGALCRARNVVFHTDASQSLGKAPFDVEAMQIDLASFTAHKLYGPKGIGGLYIRAPKVRLDAQMDGGGHEGGCRSGTLNAPGIVGFAKAVTLCCEERDTETPRLAKLRDRLKDGLLALLPRACLNGHPTQRLAGNLNLSVPAPESEKLLAGLTEIIAFSSGSACSSGSNALSHVLKAIGSYDGAAMRFGLGRFTTGEEVEYALARCAEIVK